MDGYLNRHVLVCHSMHDATASKQQLLACSGYKQQLLHKLHDHGPACHACSMQVFKNISECSYFPAIYFEDFKIQYLILYDTSATYQHSLSPKILYFCIACLYLYGARRPEHM